LLDSHGWGEQAIELVPKNCEGMFSRHDADEHRAEESLSCVDQRGGFVVHVYRSDQLSVCLGCGEDLPDDGGELGLAAGEHAPVSPAGGRD